MAIFRYRYTSELKLVSMMIAVLIIGTGGFEEVARVNTVFMSFVIDTCAAAYRELPTAVRTIGNFRQFLLQVDVQIRHPE